MQLITRYALTFECKTSPTIVSIGYNFARRSQMMEWCKETDSDGYFALMADRIFFQHESDAIMFKLYWGV